MERSFGNLQVKEIVLQPGHEWLANAGAWHVVYVRSGATYWLSAGQYRELQLGEMIIIGPAVSGSVRASRIGDARLHTFDFLPDLFCGFFTLEERRAFEIAQDTDFAEARFFPPKHPSTSSLSDLISSHGDAPSLGYRAELLGFIVGLFSDLLKRRTATARALSARRRFIQIVAEMPDTALLEQTTHKSAEICGCSPRHFSRMFLEHFGKSLQTWQSELRLLKARDLLVGSDMKIADAARASGYNSVSLFNSMFKKQFGVTPSAMRRRLG